MPEPGDNFPAELYVPEDCVRSDGDDGFMEGYADLDFAIDGDTIAVYKFDRVVQVRVERTLEEPEPEDPT